MATKKAVCSVPACRFSRLSPLPTLPLSTLLSCSSVPPSRLEGDVSPMGMVPHRAPPRQLHLVILRLAGPEEFCSSSPGPAAKPDRRRLQGPGLVGPRGHGLHQAPSLTAVRPAVPPKLGLYQHLREVLKLYCQWSHSSVVRFVQVSTCLFSGTEMQVIWVCVCVQQACYALSHHNMHVYCSRVPTFSFMSSLCYFFLILFFSLQFL